VFENYVTDVELDGHSLELALWDTTGLDDYDKLRPLSYADSHIAVICFAINNPDSLLNIDKKVTVSFPLLNGSNINCVAIVDP
jgi:Ras family protein A